MAKFRCVKRCIYKGQLVDIGEIVNIPDGETVTKCFETEFPIPLTDEEILKGVNTHFPEKDRLKIGLLRRELDALGKKPNGLWGVQKLEIEIQRAKGIDI